MFSSFSPRRIHEKVYFSELFFCRLVIIIVVSYHRLISTVKQSLKAFIFIQWTEED